jgi:predicted translin family RNA/ssDNA-binding protein
MDAILLHLSNTLGRNLWSLKKRKELYRLVKLFYLAYEIIRESCKWIHLILQKSSEQFQQERDRLLAEVESLNADGQTHKLRDAQLQKLKSLEAQVTNISQCIWIILLSLGFPTQQTHWLADSRS